MKCYKVSIDSDVFAISLVEEAAIEKDFVALSKQTIKFNSEKRMVVGPVLIPDKPIYRYANGEEFYIIFDKETIEILAQNFLNEDHNVTLDHSKETKVAKVVESWIKTGNEDKSNEYGYNEPIGTWFVAMKIYDDKLWKDIKEGKYKGFSIEAICGLDEMFNNINLNKSIKMNEMDFLDKLKALIDEAFGKKEEIVEAEETPVVEETVEETVVEPTVEELQKEIEDLKAELEAVKAERDELKAKLDEVEKEKEQIVEENVELKKQPNMKPIKCAKANGKDYMAAVKFMLK